jgi:hypothetical protein
MVNEDETKALPLEEIAKKGFKENYDPLTCHKKKFSKEYYLCKEPEKGPLCARAVCIATGKYYCPREFDNK